MGDALQQIREVLVVFANDLRGLSVAFRVSQPYLRLALLGVGRLVEGLFARRLRHVCCTFLAALFGYAVVLAADLVENVGNHARDSAVDYVVCCPQPHHVALSQREDEQ